MRDTSTSSPKETIEDVLVSNTDTLTYSEEKALQRVLNWCENEVDKKISFRTWMTVFRVVKDGIMLQIDTGDKYHYVKYDDSRGRVVYIDPRDNSRSGNSMVPVEEMDIRDIYDSGVIKLLNNQDKSQKKHQYLSLVYHEEYGTKIALGKWENDFIEYTTHEKIRYETKDIVELPRSMTASEIVNWMETTDSETVRKVAQVNHKQEWGN